MRILIYKLKTWYAKAKREYNDSKMQEVQEANNSDLKEWYISEWGVCEVPCINKGQTHLFWEHNDEKTATCIICQKTISKNQNKTNKKTKKASDKK